MQTPAEPTSPPEVKLELLPRFSRLGAALAACMIVACVLFVLQRQAAHKEDGGEVRPNRILELMARYTVGVKELLRSTKQSDAELTQSVLQDIAKFSRTDEDALRLLILKGWLNEAWPAGVEWDDISAKNAGLREDVTAVENMNANRGLAKDEAWKRLRQRHGWMQILPVRRQRIRRQGRLWFSKVWGQQ